MEEERNTKTPKPESKGPPKYANLIQRLNTLEDDWRSFKNHSRPRNHPKSPESETSSSALTYLDHVLLEKHSPRGLMSGLQHVKSPSGRSWPVEEVLRERRAALTSGRLKGRRLFFRDEQDETAKRVTEDDGSDGVEFGQRMCHFPVEKVVVVEEERAAGGDKRGGGRGGCVVAMAWFAFVLIMVTVGFILMSCSGNFVGENEAGLVPT